MCGICGELRFDNTHPDFAAVSRMTDALARRGPDHAGQFSDGPLAFGHRRLSIIDLSEHSNQPLVDHELNLARVFNGTIYNYRELRAELIALGHHFFSDGDSEVIMKAYRAWGDDCVTHFNGMFAFAIWDMHSGRLFLARDRSGIKPLYYSLDRQRLRFASTSQALIASGGVDTSIDAFALHHHLTLHAVVPAPRTIMKGIRKLPPATTLSFNTDGSHQFHTYWQLDARRLQTDKSEQDWIDELHVTLRQAVNRQSSAADVPVGVLLSGGLDSSLLVGLLAESGVRDIHTFSIGFEDVGEERADEFEYSDQVVERFQTRHHRYRIPNSEVLTRLPEAVAQMSEPMVGQDAVAFYLLSERVAREDKAVLSGQGADEVFAGYFWYPLMQAELGLPIQRFAKHYFDRNHAEYLETVERGLHTPDVTSHLMAHRLGMPNADTFMDQVLRLDTTTLIVDDPVKRVDNMTMAWGLEARVPFLDHELIELAARMPPELKLKNGGKFPLKAIARGLIPDSIIDRPKGYFPVPALKYVRGGFHDLMQDTLNSQACRSRGLFQRAYVDKLLAAPEKYFTPIRGAKLWHLALLELWLQLNVDGKA